MNTSEQEHERGFRVAAFQGRIEQGDPEWSIQRTCEALRWADERGVDVLCMPETFLQGYFETRDEAWANSIDLESSTFADVCSALAGYKATCLLGLNERRGDELYNTMVVIEDGRLIGRYSKNFRVYKYFAAGLDFGVFERAGVKYGIIICKDVSYVEPSRILSMRGARVIFSPHFNRVDLYKADRHLRRVRNHHVARAVENSVWVVRANVIWPADDKKVGFGDSFIINELGEFVCRAGLLTETILYCEIPRSSLDAEKVPGDPIPKEIYEQLLDEYRRAEKDAQQ